MDFTPTLIILYRINFREKGVAMSKKEDIESRVGTYLTELLASYGFELVDTEYVREAGTWYLRAYIDKDGGITMDDCEMVSRAFGDWLDREDFIDDSYIMEVSSPGLGRPMKKDKDFARHIGDKVEFKLYKAKNDRKEYTGILKGFDADTVTIESEDGQDEVWDRADLALIREAIDF